MPTVDRRTTRWAASKLPGLIILGFCPVIAVALVVAGIAAGDSSGPYDDGFQYWLYLRAAGFVAATAVGAGLLLARRQLELSHEGIVYRRLGRRTIIRWNQLDALGCDERRGLRLLLRYRPFDGRPTELAFGYYGFPRIEARDAILEMARHHGCRPQVIDVRMRPVSS